MKKALCLVLSILLVFALISCDNSEEKDHSPMCSTVYVSRYGKIHADSNCSGTKHYTAMPADVALDAGYTLCKKCYPSDGDI